jgi:pentose-5-phosphate-3-epimerase
LVARCGANWLVAGSALFNAKNRKEAFDAIEGGAKKGLKMKSD